MLAFQTPADGAARLVVTRDAGVMLQFCYTALWINGTMATKLNPAERVTLYVPNGDLVLKVDVDPDLKPFCPHVNGRWVQRETTMKNSETKNFRVSLSGDGVFDIHRAD